MHTEWKEERILIWGKTYPELSTKYAETVCTAGTLENGDFVRLYPIPFRYLADGTTFAKYQWIRAKIRKSEDDPRPESFKVDPTSIVTGEKVATDPHEWYGRKKLVCKSDFYQFNTAEGLMAQERQTGTSLGFVRPAAVLDVKLVDRPKEDYQAFLKKFQETKERQSSLNCTAHSTHRK